MISNLLDTLINQIPRWEQASAISTVLLIVTLLIFVLLVVLNETILSSPMG